MRIEKNSKNVTSVDEWKEFAPPKRKNQWKDGRSACELARAWCSAGTVAMPPELRDLFQSRLETRDLEVECVMPEHRISFDFLGGEPRNADLAFIGESPSGRIAVTVEAKADEPFGGTVAETLEAALERLVKNPRSQGLRRVEALVMALFAPGAKGSCKLADIRYQLLTATAGTLAFAQQQNAPYAVFVIHEFVATETSDDRHDHNAADFEAFFDRLGGTAAMDVKQTGLRGPFTVPGAPLFESVPQLFIGKVTTRRR